MLEAAMGLLANAVAFDERSGWEEAKRRWMAAYHEQRAYVLPRRTGNGLEPPMPPREWLDKFSASSKGSGGYGWQQGWLAGYAARQMEEDASRREA